MKRRAVLLVGLAAATGLASALVGAGTGAAQDTPEDAIGALGSPAVGAVFAPDTDPAYAQNILDALRRGPATQQFSDHWSPAGTALNNGGGAQGDALELTWSIVPDGTSMPAQFFGDTTCASNLIATFDGIYGAGLWQAEIQKVWDDWTGLAGNEYTPAVALDANGTPVDDGALWPDSPGVAGVRGDIRIGGCNIDGNSNILAYNFFPNTGDMKIDATDSFFASASLTTGFHNVFSHEHGHGAGLNHVCPRNGTKLMEPTVNLGFVGLQHDDIRGVQRGYGDRFELIGNPNDTRPAATPLSPIPSQSEASLSLDGTGDVDWFSFTANAGDTVDVTVAPNGFVYNESADPGSLCNGGATPGSPLDSSAIQDLAFEIRNSAGALTTVNANGAGASETISGFVLPAAGTYFVRVRGSGTDDAQLYDLTVAQALAPPMDYGDAPAPYPTLFADDGARHGDFGVNLGVNVDATESDGLPSVDAQGDDNDGVDDEDGVTFTTPIERGATAGVDVVLNGPSAPLNAWVDFNSDGDWNDAGEQIFTDEPITPGANSLTFAVPADAMPGATFARFRVDAAGGLSPTGQVGDGEVEDYRVVIVGVPSAPSGVTAVPGDAQVAVSWTAPTSDGGSPITGYTVTAAPGGATCSTAGATSCTVTGLTNGTAYTFRVRAKNAIGTGPPSVASAPVTPKSPTPDVVTVEPGRFLDTRGNGFTVDDQFLAGGKVTGGTFTKVQIAGRGDVPADAVGVEVNITAIQNEGRGFATLYPCTTDIPVASTLNYTPGINIANATTVALNSSGEVCIFTSTTAHYALDVVAYVPAGSDVATVEPGRFLDTRANGFTIDDQFLAGGKVTGGTFTKVQIAGRGDVPANAVGVEVNITAIQNEGRGFATLYPCTTDIPVASTLNYTPGINIANATTVALNASGEVCIFTSTTAHFALDVVAYVPAGSDVATIEPGRFLDTRANGFTIDNQFLAGGKVTGGTFIKVQIAGRGDVPANAVGVEVNITAIQNEGRGFATLYPCTSDVPIASTLNYTPGINIANATTVALNASGEVCIFTNVTAHYALDVVAYIAA